MPKQILFLLLHLLPLTQIGTEALCSDESCMHGGTYILDYATCQCECTCPCEYTGPCCESPLDFQNCSSTNPCRENGVCIEGTSNGSYYCDCPSGFGGDCCQSDINFCIEGHCMNGGTCVEGKGNLTSCICPSTYTGELCESLYCPVDYCDNGGTCSVDSAAKPPDLNCDCPMGFKGPYCEVDVDFCSVTCPDLECIEGIGTETHCLCPEECCTNCTSPCLSGPCITNGTCEVPTDSGCVCSECYQTPSSSVLSTSFMPSSVEPTYKCVTSMQVPTLCHPSLSSPAVSSISALETSSTPPSATDSPKASWTPSSATNSPKVSLTPSSASKSPTSSIPASTSSPEKLPPAVLAIIAVDVVLGVILVVGVAVVSAYLVHKGLKTKVGPSKVGSDDESLLKEEVPKRAHQNENQDTTL